MVDPLAPSRDRARRPASAAWMFALGLALLPAAPALARQDEEPADEPTTAEAEQAEVEQREQLEDTVFIDPVAKQAMRNDFEQLYTSYLAPGARAAIDRMARTGQVDRGAIDRHIKAAARALTDRDNIAEVIRTDTGAPNVRRLEAIEEAGVDLMSPYLIPASERNPRFMQEYNAQLLAVAPGLLQNHLFARVQVMEALSRMGDPQALGLLIELINSDDQPSVVKLLAAEGISEVARAAGLALSPADRERAANALVAYVRDKPDAFWLARARAIEALGNLRTISGITNRDQAVFAIAVLEFLGNEDLRVEPRAYAAWALGMIEVPSGYPQVNYALVAYYVGRLAETIGQRIVELSDPESEVSNPERATYLTGVLVNQVFVALDGVRGVRNSGLRNAGSLGPHRNDVNRVHQLVKQVAAAAVELARSVGVQREPRRTQLAQRLNELKAFLDANAPEDTALVPGTREFAVTSEADAATR